MDESRLRSALVDIGRRLYAKGLIAGSEGNLSVRLGPDRLLTTPAGTNKGFLAPEELVLVDLAGRPLGPGRPSTELALHLSAYRAVPGAAAVVHAHPPRAVALSLAGVKLDRPFLAEAVTALGGGIPTVPYQTPGTDALAEAVAQALTQRAAAIMERHGAVTIGADPYQASDRMEILERVAEAAFYARIIGFCRPLSDVEVARLLGGARVNEGAPWRHPI